MFKKFLISICIIVIFGIWYISPILKPFPALTGQYQIGSTTFYFTDQKRTELFSDKSTDKRNLVVHVLYPAGDISNFKKTFYLDNKMFYFQKMFSKLYSIPEWISKLFFRDITTHAYLNAPLSQNKSNYPVVLFSHGLLGVPSDMYTAILEDLASHGYIVMGIDHPYFNIITLDRDGEIVSSNTLSQKFKKMSPQEQKQFQSDAIDIYKADISFLLDQLAKINEDEKSMFYQRLDLNNIGIMGHSAGGTAAIEFCRTDSRCKAVINLDGWYDHIIGHTPFKQPLLLLFGSKSTEITEPTSEYLKQKQITREQYFEREQNIAEHRKELCAISNCLMVIFPDVAHDDFGDAILFKWPLRSWNAVDSYKTIALINEHILKFFDKYLKQEV